MQGKLRISILFITLFLLIISVASFAENKTGGKEIIVRHLKAVGGDAKIQSTGCIKFNFATPEPNSTIINTVYAMGEDTKIILGEPPLIETVVVVKNNQIKVNSFAGSEGLTERQKREALASAKLYAGYFSLMKYKDILEYSGIKKYGPEKHHVFSVNETEYSIEFYIDSDSFLLKRMELSNNKKGLDNYKLSFEISDYTKVDGIPIPKGFFRADMGAEATARGADVIITNVKTNVKVAEDFFNDTKLNYGNVNLKDGVLVGNGVSSDFVDRFKYSFVLTNWTDDIVKKAGFKPKDKITIEYNGEKYEANYLASINELRGPLLEPGNIYFVKGRNNSYYIWFLFGEQFKKISETYKPLTEIKAYKSK